MAGEFEAFTESGCTFWESSADGWEVPGFIEVMTGGTEGSASLGGLVSILSDCASLFSRVDDAGPGAVSWIRSYVFVAGGVLAQEKKVITNIRCIINHFQFFIPVKLLSNPLYFFEIFAQK